MTEILDVVQKHWGIILSVAGFVGFIVRLTMDSKYIKREEMHSLKQTVSHNEHRLDALETKVQDLPTTSDLAEIKILMAKLDGKSDKIATKVEGLSHQVQLLIEKEVKNG
ncbi:DUF2730 family protein [Gallibacterium anatis]|uniref:DUF2730 family protein n=1 Tax=Gallibacterium anatis TaxID=750 RepID=UPI00053110CA|nr:DUF2730 family protein [Gallibacterium anatis]KGQ39899.1 hypothetical protein JP30_09310 [Gallibacterium anatis IPDH697-78]